MDAVIMCAGLGTRVRPLTNFIPKPLIPVAGRSSLERSLEALPEQIERVIIVIGHHGEQIRQRVGVRHSGRPVDYLIQSPLNGTGGALRQVEPLLRSERFLVLNGDDLYAAEDLSRLVRIECGLLVLRTTLNKEEDAWKTSDDGRLLSLERQPAGVPANINVGAYCLDQNWFTTKPVLVPGKASEWSLPHAIPELIGRGLTVAAIPASWWMPLGTMEEFEAAQRVLTR